MSNPCSPTSWLWADSHLLFSVPGLLHLCYGAENRTYLPPRVAVMGTERAHRKDCRASHTQPLLLQAGTGGSEKGVMFSGPHTEAEQDQEG